MKAATPITATKTTTEADAAMTEVVALLLAGVVLEVSACVVLEVSASVVFE